jgi:hypothetical protein
MEILCYGKYCRFFMSFLKDNDKGNNIEPSATFAGCVDISIVVVLGERAIAAN